MLDAPAFAAMRGASRIRNGLIKATVFLDRPNPDVPATMAPSPETATSQVVGCLCHRWRAGFFAPLINHRLTIGRSLRLPVSRAIMRGSHGTRKHAQHLTNGDYQCEFI